MSEADTLSPALLTLMRAFERSVGEHMDEGLPAWVAQVGDDTLSRRSAFPTGLFAEKARSGFGSSSDALAWLHAASRPSSFSDALPETRRTRSLLFGATIRAVHDLLATMGRHSLFEVAHNAGFFAHLSSTLWTYDALDAEPGSTREPLIYWADLASQGTEPDVGGDFAVIVPLTPGTCKLAIVQAKLESPERRGRASLYRPVSKKPGQQFHLLEAHEATRTIDGPEKRRSIFRSWCFYAFWHRPWPGKPFLPPIVRSVRDIRTEHRRIRGPGSRHQVPTNVSTTAAGVDLAAFMALHLPDANSAAGLICSPDDLPKLVGEHPLRPRTIALLNLPGHGWPLGYWTKLLHTLGGYVDMTPSVAPTPRRPSVSTQPRRSPGR